MKRGLLILLVLLIIPFVTANNYTGSFDLDKPAVQLGDEFTFSGEIYLNNRPLEEQINAIIYFDGPEDSKEVYLSIFNGEFSILNQFRNTESGIYEIDVTLKDLDGEILEEFNEVESISIDNELELNANIKKDEIAPGDLIKITGTIMRGLDNLPKELSTIKIHLDDLILTSDATNGEFEYTFSTSPTISSNYHDIEIVAEDEFGNKGSVIEKIYIEPLPVALEIDLEKESFLPFERVIINIRLLDQAKDEMVGDVEIRIYTPKNNRVLKENTKTDKPYNYELDKYAEPGYWRIQAKSEGLKAEYTFEVKKVKEIEITQLGNNIFEVKNIGNVKYNDVVEIVVNDGEEKTIRKRTNLNPGASFKIDLSREIGKKGHYNLAFVNLDKTFSTTIEEDLSFMEKVGSTLAGLTGQVVGKSGTAPSNAPTYSTIALLAIIILVIVARLRLTRKRKDRFKGPKKGKISKLFSSLVPNIKIRKKKHGELKELKAKILHNIDSPKKSSEDEPPIPPSKPKEQKPLRVKFDEPFKFK